MSISAFTENKELYNAVDSVGKHLENAGSAKKNLLPSSSNASEADLRSQVQAFINHCKM